MTEDVEGYDKEMLAILSGTAVQLIKLRTFILSSIDFHKHTGCDGTPMTCIDGPKNRCRLHSKCSKCNFELHPMGGYCRLTDLRSGRFL